MPLSRKGEAFCRQKTLQAHKQKSNISSHIFIIYSIMELIYIYLISQLEQ